MRKVPVHHRCNVGSGCFPNWATFFCRNTRYYTGSAFRSILLDQCIQPLSARLFHALTAAPLALYAAVVGWQEQFTFEHVMYSFPSDNRSRRGISPQNGHGLNSILAIAFSSFLHGLLAPSDYTEEVGVAPLQVLIADAVRCIAGRHRVPAALHDTRTLVDALSA